MTTVYASPGVYIAAAGLLTAVVQACDRLTDGMFVAFGLGLALRADRSAGP